MTSQAPTAPAAAAGMAPLVACTISRDVQNFDLLIEDMEAALGETWGDLGFAEALAFFDQPDADTLEFVAMAIDAEDEDNLALLSDIITKANARAVKVILIAEDVTPAALHQLLRVGADEFVPYAAEMRDKRVMRAEEAANKLPTQMTLATMMLTVPPLLIILVAPSAVGITELGNLSN